MAKTYNILDCGDFYKLEQVGPYRLHRPAASAVWLRSLGKEDWQNHDAHFERDRGGEGEWTIKNKRMPDHWDIEIGKLKFRIRLTGFGHLGIFPEQQDNWAEIDEAIRQRNAKPDEFKVLNLFAYTGGSTLAAAKAGAAVVHLDASKTSVTWARENAELSGLGDRPIRWIVDDVQDFVSREVRRGSKYQGIILDPPSYGRGPKKQMWKIEDHLNPLLEQLAKLMADDFCFWLLSSHSQGYTPIAHENQIKQVIGGRFQGEYRSREMVLPSADGKLLPSGSSSLFLRV